ncbi:hypothetical protein JTB14_004857 [Gonioctena quinquepunctata]|nr:hypothetical protein JTB14_004857 [Gonioctena quinquepunctata]
MDKAGMTTRSITALMTQLELDRAPTRRNVMPNDHIQVSSSKKTTIPEQSRNRKSSKASAAARLKMKAQVKAQVKADE